jgi:hypothetical protein
MVAGIEIAHGGGVMEAVGSRCEVRQVYASASREHSGLRSAATVQVGAANCKISEDHEGVSHRPVPLTVNCSVQDVYPVD